MGASLGTHLLSKKDRHLSEATGRTYVKEDDKHDRPLMDSSHQPYGDIWPGGVRLFDQVSDAKAKSELVSKLIPHIWQGFLLPTSLFSIQTLDSVYSFEGFVLNYLMAEYLKI